MILDHNFFRFARSSRVLFESLSQSLAAMSVLATDHGVPDMDQFATNVHQVSRLNFIFELEAFVTVILNVKFDHFSSPYTPRRMLVQFFPP
jgi:hypothetical protein